jgi:hypothetical protein
MSHACHAGRSVTGHRSAIETVKSRLSDTLVPSSFVSLAQRNVTLRKQLSLL